MVGWMLGYGRRRERGGVEVKRGGSKGKKRGGMEREREQTDRGVVEVERD